MHDYTGKTVFVAGGTTGINFAIAEGFAKEGANVSICARDRERLAKAQAVLEAHDVGVHAASCDVADADALQAYIAEAHSALGG